MTIQVGSIVRAKRPLPNGDATSKRAWGRAMVADIDEEEDSKAEQQEQQTCALLWEPLAVQPIQPCIAQDFIVAPKNLQSQSDMEETIEKLSDLQDLLPFEGGETNHTDVDIAAWKERGDTLLRHGDASSAASYYERGLHESSCISIGSTVIISVQGFPRLAEVDCIDDDDNVDIALVDSGEESTVKKSTILIAVMESDQEQLQERMLLNLSRCMLQLSDLDTSSDKAKYLKAAILATSLVVTLSYSRVNEEENQASSATLSTNAQTALFLRAKAQIGLSKWPQAKRDANKLVAAGNQQGTKLLATIDKKRKLQAETDKQLAKEMCRLVQSTTSDGTSVSQMQRQTKRKHR